jgi:hypothetical protein
MENILVFFTPKDLKGAGLRKFGSSPNPFLNLSPRESPLGSAKNVLFL